MHSEDPGGLRLGRCSIGVLIAVMLAVFLASARRLGQWRARPAGPRTSNLRCSRRASGRPVRALRVLGFALLPSVFFVSGAQGSSQTSTSPGSDPSALSRAQQQFDQWRAYIRSPAAIAARKTSRLAYAHQDAAGALARDHQDYPGAFAPGFKGVGASGEGHILRKLGASTALVKDAKGHTSVASSALPLDGTTASGASAPLDLSLNASSGGFVAQSSLAPVTIPGASDGAVAFSKDHFGVRFGSGDPVAGRQVGDSILYPNVDGLSGSTDAVVRPIPLGVDISYVLRSIQSPGSQTLSFDLPAGWSLVKPADGSGTIAIENGSGSVVSRVMPPIAVDAQQQTVPATYHIKNATQLTINVPHTSGDYAYPILVDPPIYSQSDYAGGSAGAHWGQTSNDSGAFQTYNGNTLSGWKFQPGANPFAGAYAVYTKHAPVGAYVYDLTQTGVYHHAVDSLELGAIARADGSAFEGGSWYGSWQNNSSGSGVGAGYFFGAELQNSSWQYCATAGCSYGGTSHITTDNYAEFGLQDWHGAGAQPSDGSQGSAYLSDATLYFSDNIAPTISAPAHNGYTPGTWVQNVTDTVSATASVPSGLGMSQVALTGIAPSPAPVTASCTPISPGSTADPCPSSLPGSFTYNTTNLPEGSNVVSLTAQNAGGNTDTTATPANTTPLPTSWIVNIDRTAPPPPATTGLNAGDSFTDPDPETLTITPADPPAPGVTASSGPASVNVSVDGGVATSIACTTSCQWVPPDGLDDGAHTVAVSALDQAGNVGAAKTIPFTIIIDPPANASTSAPIADQIESVLNNPSLSSVFTGDVVNADGTVTIYATAYDPIASALTNALGASASGTYTVQVVPRSADNLLALTQQIANDQPTLSNQGIQLVDWGSNPVDDKVDVTVLGDVVTAQVALDQRYGVGMTSVTPSLYAGLPQLDANRYSQPAAYKEGSRIFFRYDATHEILCTSGFEFRGRRGVYGVTAGHCATNGQGVMIDDSQAGRQTFSNISTNYFRRDGDFATYDCQLFCDAAVWDGPKGAANPGFHKVLGWCDCNGANQKVTVDGATTGEVPDLKVQKFSNGCATFGDGAGGKVTDCHLYRVSTADGSVACDRGDSGGPVYQRTSSDSVYLTGVIAGSGGSFLSPNSTCYYTQMRQILHTVHGSIVHGG